MTVSVAPNVSAARTAMPSIAEASYAGDERSAQTGAAVTRPSASASATSTASTRVHTLQPGRERLAGRDVGEERGAPRNGRLSHRARRRPPCRRRVRSPARARGSSRRRPPSVRAARTSRSAGSRPRRGPRPGRRRAALRRSGTSRDSAARTIAAGGGAVMPATVRTSAIPTSRKTTSAERGLPGRPISGTPSQSASSVGFPGLSASPWQTTSPSRPTTVAVRSRAPTDEPAETTTTSSSADRLGEHALERVGVVGDDPAQDRLAARLAHEPGQRRRAGVAHLARSGLRGRRRHDLVAGRDDPDPRWREGRELGDPGRGQQPEIRRAQRAAGGCQQVARARPPRPAGARPRPERRRAAAPRAPASARWCARPSRPRRRRGAAGRRSGSPSPRPVRPRRAGPRPCARRR